MEALVNFTQSFVYLTSLLCCDVLDHHNVYARIKEASKAIGVLRDRNVSQRLKGKMYSGSVLATPLHGKELWCITAESIITYTTGTRSVYTRNEQGGNVSILSPSNIFDGFE